MSYEITPNPSFASHYGGRVPQKSEEEKADGSKITLTRGLSIPSYITQVYGVKPVSFSGYYSFLDRDSVVKHYDPGTEDPFVFRDRASIAAFHSHTKKYYKYILDQLKALGYPMMPDAYKQEVPDHERAFEILLSKQAKTSEDLLFVKNYVKDSASLAYLIGEVDIAGKISLVRTVKPGWFAVSYDGKVAKEWNQLAPAMSVIKKAVEVIIKSPLFKDLYAKTLNEQGDPLDTNVGAPTYSSELSADGLPWAKLKYAEMFKASPYSDFDFPALLKWKASRTPDPQLATSSFHVAAIRRLQPGTKTSRVWKFTSMGLTFEESVKGDSTNRVAFMPEYLQNLFLSPMQTFWKTIRKMIPGTFHDGESRQSYMVLIKQLKPFICEADYSNYDRTIPINGIAALHDIFSKGISNDPKIQRFLKDLLFSTFSGVKFIWPEQTITGKGRGWMFQPKSNALLSGLKITSEVGTFCNLIVVIQSLLDSGVLNEESAFKYLTTFARKGKLQYDSYPLYLIQSDDTCFLNKDLDQMLKTMASFKKCGSWAGFKSEVTLGDRFLMRHIADGVDKPVAARVLQNTLSNEDSYQDPLIFTVGLASRTDGMCGFRSVDPFKLGLSINQTKTMDAVEVETLAVMRTFLSTARVPVQPAITMVDYLERIAKARLGGSKTGLVQLEKEVSHLRQSTARVLAQREARQASSKDLTKTWISALLKDKHHPATQLLIDTIKTLSPEYASLFAQLENKEHKVYEFIMKKINVPLSLWNHA